MATIKEAIEKVLKYFAPSISEADLPIAAEAVSILLQGRDITSRMRAGMSRQDALRDMGSDETLLVGLGADAGFLVGAESGKQIEYADLTGSPEEVRLRTDVGAILKHHGILNGVLTADLVSMFLAAQALKVGEAFSAGEKAIASLLKERSTDA